MNHRIQIRGGAGTYEAAAVVAVIQRVIHEQSATRSMLPKRDEPPAWVKAGRLVSAGETSIPVVPGPGLNWPEM